MNELQMGDMWKYAKESAHWPSVQAPPVFLLASIAQTGAYSDSLEVPD